MKISTYIIYLNLLILTGCSLFRLDASKYPEAELPPGTIKLKDNFYFDRTEITNHHWCEYLYWTSKVYGEESEEYSSALPDPKTWLKYDPSYSALDTFYLRHPSYRDYPVVGLTYEQVSDFAKWRSDRVFEYLLIREEVIVFHKTYNIDTFFTIEKYFFGQYMNYQPDSRFMYYPSYSIPSESDYLFVDSVQDSVNEQIDRFSLKKNPNWSPIWCKETFEPLNIQSGGKLEPTTHVFQKGNRKYRIINHLNGNVREFTSTPNLYFGLSFVDSCSQPRNKLEYDTTGANTYTGFRNVCTFRKWNSD